MPVKTHKKPEQAFRYPGGKRRIADAIRNWFPPAVICDYMRGQVTCYCEPFVGSGAIFACVLPSLNRGQRAVLGDMDVGICAFWRCVSDRKKCDELGARINALREPTPEMFYRLKELDGTHDGDDVDAAFRKMVLHFISFSGVGAKAGGPIGGREQRSEFDVTCRWNPERNIRNLLSLSYYASRLSSVEVVHGDFADSLARVPADGFVYLDPPYYLKGGELYVHNMAHADHARLARTLHEAEYDWVLSYDDHIAVRELYHGWAGIHDFEMTATIDTKRGQKSRRKNNELVITRDMDERDRPDNWTPSEMDTDPPPMDDLLPRPSIDASKKPLPSWMTPGNKVDPNHPFAALLHKLSALAGEITKVFKTEQGKMLLAALTHVAKLKVPTRFVAYTDEVIDNGELFGGTAKFVGFYALRKLIKQAGLAKRPITAAFIRKTFLDALNDSESDMLDSEVWE